ncbi:hypothetical protein AZI86_15540 [Bdellovibrio bacteriovorus]|uniref:Uncharacterized protein n=1 Tax=Bdellovibrio bacteriovorus TaxID=959 RepID=A0A150WHM8_BDEBC|nr:hypothetical protein [Bdellovibrio bacteriovorus]KYG63126.1 hypothetical protein AZI86_15540 [Bdellovibrio bacteriovorus]
MIRILLSVIFLVSFHAAAAVPSNKTTVIYFGQAKAEEFDSKIKPLFDDKAGCKNCELVNYTPYTKEGELDTAALQERIDSLPSSTSFVFFDFNLKSNEQTKPLIEAINKRADLGLVVVGSAGVPKENEASGPLSKTMLGQVRGALIIGELGERDRLIPTGFYGPEMLTALRPPKDMIGQGHSPLIFAANLADKWSKRSPQEWSEHFRTKKMKTRKIWLDLGDLF